MLYYILTCNKTGETDDVVVCDLHAKDMPLVNGEDVRAYPADKDCNCEFCP